MLACARSRWSMPFLRCRFIAGHKTVVINAMHFMMVSLMKAGMSTSSSISIQWFGRRASNLYNQLVLIAGRQNSKMSLSISTSYCRPCSYCCCHLNSELTLLVVGRELKIDCCGWLLGLHSPFSDCGWLLRRQWCAYYCCSTCYHTCCYGFISGRVEQQQNLCKSMVQWYGIEGSLALTCQGRF